MRGKALALAAALSLTLVFLIDVCGLVFGCGCRSLASGAAAACNVHHASPPHCPWCAHPFAGGAVAVAAIASVQAWILWRPGRAKLPLRFVLAVLSFPLTAAAFGALQGFLWDYWSE
jgi:hypothetical protein